MGIRIAAHATAAGKAELAFSPQERIDAYRLTPVPLTDRTIVDRGELLEALARIREAGYAIDDGEHAVGVTCVAAPVLDRAGVPCAALSVSGPTARLRSVDGEDGMTALGELLMLTAQDASSTLSYLPRAGGLPTLLEDALNGREGRPDSAEALPRHA